MITTKDAMRNLSIEDMLSEKWVDTEGYEGIYKVSNYGRVKSLSRTLFNGKAFFNTKEKILSPKLGNNGYYSFSLSKEKKKVFYLAHRLIAKAFIPNPENKPTVNHKDSDRANNSISNLEWNTYRENNCHKIKTTKNKYIGVSFHKRNLKWTSYIFIEKKLIHLGSFESEEEAYKSRVEYEKKNNIKNKYL
jgi:hypothetical protein